MDTMVERQQERLKVGRDLRQEPGWEMLDSAEGRSGRGRGRGRSSWRMKHGNGTLKNVDWKLGTKL
jgi:hypothetical protein